MSDINRLVAAWVSAQQRHFYASTRGIATPEQRMAWEREAEEIIAAHDADVVARCDRTVESAREQLANLGMTPGQIETALGWAVRLAAEDIDITAAIEAAKDTLLESPALGCGCCAWPDDLYESRRGQ